MKFVAIGRHEILLRTIEMLVDAGHELAGVLTAAPRPNTGPMSMIFGRLLRARAYRVMCRIAMGRKWWRHWQAWGRRSP